MRKPSGWIQICLCLDRQGICLAKQGEYVEAIEAMTSIRLDPKYAMLDAKGISLAKQGNYDESIECHDEAIGWTKICLCLDQQRHCSCRQGYYMRPSNATMKRSGWTPNMPMLGPTKACSCKTGQLRWGIECHIKL